MQEIRERFPDGSERVDRLAGFESLPLLKAFRVRREEAERRLQSGETEALTIHESRRIGRNDPCPCGSNIKFKKYCGRNIRPDDKRFAE